MAVPLHYTIYERPSYSVVSSNALWRDPARAAQAKALREVEQQIGGRSLYFPQVLRDARRMEEYYPGLSPYSPKCMDKLGVSLAHLESKCKNFYDSAEVERVYYPEIEKASAVGVFPCAIDALVYNHDVFNKDYTGDRKEDQAAKNPGVNANYANIVHNDLNDNSGCVRCRELLTQKPAGISGDRCTTRKRRLTRRCRAGSYRSTSPNQWRPWASTPSCSVPGPLSRTSRTSPIIASTTIGSAKPRHPLHLPSPTRVVLVSPAEAQRGLDAQMLRLHHGRFRLAMVVPHFVCRPDRARRRSLPQEPRGQIVRLLLRGRESLPAEAETAGEPICGRVIIVGIKVSIGARGLCEWRAPPSLSPATARSGNSSLTRSLHTAVNQLNSADMKEEAQT